MSAEDAGQDIFLPGLPVLREVRCKDFPDVRVADAEALEIALRETLDDDEALDAAALVMRQGWRPPRQNEEANVIQIEVRFDKARSAQWAATVAGHLRQNLLDHLAEHMPRKTAKVVVTRVYNNDDNEDIYVHGSVV